MVNGREVGKHALVAHPALPPLDRLRVPGLPAAAEPTAYENVAFALEVIGKTQAVARRVVPEVLELVGLGGKEHRYPQELSGGEQQRVAVARAFVNRPLILLADEPTGNLDPDTSIEIMRLLDRINRTGTTVVMVTHDSNIVNQMRRRVVEIEERQDRPRPAPRRVRGGPLSDAAELRRSVRGRGRPVAQRDDDHRDGHHDGGVARLLRRQPAGRERRSTT